MREILETSLGIRMRITEFKLKEIKIEVTHKCGLNCRHCSSEANQDSRKTMSWDSCQKILEEANNMGVTEVSFSGGEPLLWNEIKDAVSFASKLGLKVVLYSSGNVDNTQEQLTELKSKGLGKIIYSIFDHESKRHDQLTGVNGSFKWMIESAEISQKLGLITELHFVPFSLNYKSIPGVVKTATSMGIKTVSLLRFVPHGRGCDIREWQLSKSQNIELRKIVKDLREEGYSIRLGSPYNFLWLTENPKCLSGIDRLTIGPDLRLFPCDAFKQIRPGDIGIKNDKFSSLQNHSLQECWFNSQFLKLIRTQIGKDFEGECKQCNKLHLCNSGCIAQKFINYGTLAGFPDPMCLRCQSIDA